MDESFGWNLFYPFLDGVYILILLLLLRKYCQYFKNQVDPYTITIFVCIMIAVTIRMTTKLIVLFGFKCNHDNNVDHEFDFICTDSEN